MALQSFVKMDEKEHRYFDVNRLEYLSVSKVTELVKTFFDKDMISARTAESRGVSQEEVLAEWKETNDDSISHGNDIHKAIEMYQKTSMISEENRKYESMIKSICATYNEYHKVFQEEVLYNKKYRIAGTADKILQVTSSGKSYIDIEDYKTNKSKGIEYFSKYRNKMLFPVDHYEDCNFIHYALQLSLYAYMIEEMLGKKVRMLHIVYIPPDNFLAWKKIPVPYLKNDVIQILEFYKKTILDKLNKNIPAVELSEEPNFG